MPSDRAALEASLRARALWRELAEIYDQIDARLAKGGGGVDPLSTRMAALMLELVPLTAEIAKLRANAGESDRTLAALWQETDIIVAALAARQPQLVRAATEARDAAAAELARLRVTRSHAARYGNERTGSPRFTSRLV